MLKRKSRIQFILNNNDSNSLYKRRIFASKVNEKGQRIPQRKWLACLCHGSKIKSCTPFLGIRIPVETIGNLSILTLFERLRSPEVSSMKLSTRFITLIPGLSSLSPKVHVELTTVQHGEHSISECDGQNTSMKTTSRCRQSAAAARLTSSRT
ncbi:hypothetical protein ACUH78_16560 [Thauera sp. ZXT1-4]|uniref:hypothetical protein n=1 Tax=Thauera sp. ZXT1-4 TaxID=3460294 RepID=UPI004040721A